MDYTDEALTLAYRKIREARQQLSEDFKRADHRLETDMGLIEQELLKRMGENTGIKNKHGSVTKIIRTKYWSTDWDSFRKFAVAHDAVSLIENRIQQRNMAAWLAQHPTEVPPGLQVDRRYTVVVTKPRSKPDNPVEE